MIIKLLRVDFLKIKRKGFWFLTLLGPFGVIALQMVNYGLRKDCLFSQSDNRWEYYLDNVSTFTPLALVLGIVILTSFMASVENETNAWKQLIALPVTKTKVYLSKFTVLAILLFTSSFLLMMFSLTYGVFLELGKNVPIVYLIKNSFYPYFASLPVLAFHLWLALTSTNQGVPITIGVLGFIFTYSSYFLPDWMIWKWPTLMNEWNEPVINVLLGLIVGCLIYVIGMLDFSRRDVN